ncbi:group XIIB secretory phospholipase A2-like protein isoform X2 [Alosa alosa]|uniref:group XIIB secretory phospholipase A2-like protein isoform X2 n=1 Tax=Alosa alosa TaxID=278164 RepID=UPI0020151E16|nr:group XIIB secretory phospholipase A2-like protein isoform X2 [Alosa alosa]
MQLIRVLALLLLCVSPGRTASLIHARKALEETEAPAVTEEAPVTNSPAEEPLVADSLAEKPLVADSSAEEPLVADSPAEEPLVADSPAEEPLVADSLAEEPLVADSPAEKPLVVNSQTVESPAMDGPIMDDSPAADSPAEEETLMADSPVQPEEEADAAAGDIQVADEPALDSPAEEAAVGEAPAMDAPADATGAVDTPAGEEAPGDAPVADQMAADAPADDTVVGEAPVEEMMADAPVDEGMTADATVDEMMAADAPSEDIPADLHMNTFPLDDDEDITSPLPSSFQATTEGDWAMSSIRQSFQAVNGYFDSLVELMGGRNGVCQYKCRYGKTPTPRIGYVMPEANGCSSSLLGFEFDLGIPAMTKCCNQLDVCYDTCSSNKNRCDSKFRWCLHGICSELKKSLGFVSKVEVCESMADAMYNTVWTLGCRSYMSSQRAACFCEGTERDEL